MNKPTKPYISVVIPIYNEEGNIAKLFTRLTAVLTEMDKPYEIIFTNDGSSDRSGEILAELYNKHRKHMRVIEFNGNFGQHMAVLAGFKLAKGDIIITLDADLQDPPEEIPKLVVKMEEGYDLVSGVRHTRKDRWFRKYVSKIINKVRDKITQVKLTDHGCMLRAYARHVIDLMIASNETSMFIPALAYSYASNPTEIVVAHNARASGESKYSLYKLIRLNFDLMTGYSLVPLQLFTLIGFIISVLSILFVIYLFLRRIFIGPEVQGVFTLFAIMFFLIGVILIGLGIMGEYIGRIYVEVRKRPRYAIKQILGQDGEKNE